MPSWTSTVTERHEVRIPQEIAREFHIEPGTRLKWEKAGEGAILVKPMPSRATLARELMGAGRRWLKPEVDPVGELIRERQQDDELDLADEQQ